MLSDKFHLSKTQLLTLFDADMSMLTRLVSMDDSAYRSAMTQERFLGNVGANTQRGYYERKPPSREALFLHAVMESLAWADRTKLRNTLSYLRSERRRGERAVETAPDKRARYQRQYYARRKRERKAGVMRFNVPRDLYSTIVTELDDAGRGDLVEQLMSCKK